MIWKIVYTKQTQKDALKIKSSGLKNNALKIIEILKINPFITPPPYKKLVGDLKGTFLRRINIQHRIVYQIFEDRKTIKILRMWTHYEL